VTLTGRAGDLAIETRALTKRFGSQTAVDAIDLSVPTGSVFGFLGPNGSGKTTSIRVMLGLAAATSGEVAILGESMPGRLAGVLPQVGALVEGPAFYPFLSGAANLRRLDSADRAAPGRTRRARVDRALERVGLSNAAGKRVAAYSLGMKQRLGIANALLMPRRLLVLDEPTNGLDPQGTREVRALVRSLAGEGTTVFVSSHLLAEVEHMCTHAAIMSAGRLVAQGTLDELRAGETRVRVRTPDAADAMRVLATAGLVAALEPAPEVPGAAGTAVAPTGADGADHWVSASLELPASGRDAPVERGTSSAAGHLGTGVLPEQLVAALVAGGVRVRGFHIEDTSLEDRFVALTGEGFNVVQ
jgi:ABC-type multidrug transport system ATPase subunit